MIILRTAARGRRYLPASPPTRLKSSSAINLVPHSIKEAIKKGVIDEIAKHSEVKKVNKDSIVNGKKPIFDSQYKEKKSYHGYESKYGIHNVLTQEEIDSPLSPIGEDPLVEWHLHKEPTNSFPSTISPLSEGTDPFILSAPDTALLSESIRANLVTANHPVLNQAASHFFSPDASPGKMIRPTMVFLLSKTLTSEIFPAQRRLAEIAEMIHTASLFHDDVIDDSDTRRGNPSVHRVFGNKVAILAGDFLLARASRSLSRLRSVVVMESMSVIIDHLVQGEVMQYKHLSRAEFEQKNYSSDDDDSIYQETRMEYYLRKNFFKTGSLMAQSCMSTAILGGMPPETVDACYRYGKHIGLAFQLVDDILDFKGSEEILGKPALNDLKAGLATAPVLHVMNNEDYRIELEEMMGRKFKGGGDVQRACDLVEKGDGIQYSRNLAQVHAELAIQAIMELPVANGNDHFRDALVHLSTLR